MFLIGVIGSIVVLTDHLVSNADGTWGVVQAVLFGLFGGTVVGLFIGFALVMAWWSVKTFYRELFRPSRPPFQVAEPARERGERDDEVNNRTGTEHVKPTSRNEPRP